MSKIITSTHYNRPNCTKQMIEHLVRCSGIEDYTVYFGVEPDCPEVLDEIEKYPLNKIVEINKKLLGCWPNKKKIISMGFTVSDYVIHVEDDVILAKDALEYFEWAKKNRRNFASVTAFSIEKRFQDNLNLNRIGVSSLYSPIAWATWFDEFSKIYNVWDGSDKELQSLWVGREHLTPEVSRAKHIGVGKGIYSHPDITELVESLEHAVFCFNGLITNSKQEEWSKLDDNNIKSKCLDVYVEYDIEQWSDNFPQEEPNYFIDQSNL